MSQDHLLILHLLYTRIAERGVDSRFREGYASLDSLREISRMPAWLVWELTEELQDLGLVNCVWNSRGLDSLSSRGLEEPSSELRFLRGTQVGLTEEGRSYPPLLEYHQQRQQRRWEKPRASTSRDSGRSQPRPGNPSPGRRPARRLEPLNQPSRAYHVYCPREQAARRLVYLACAFSVLVLAAAIYLILTLT